MMTKRLLVGGILLLSGVSSGSFSAQGLGSIAGRVTLQSSGEGIPAASVTMCRDTGRQLISETALRPSDRLPSREGLQSIRIGGPSETAIVTSTSKDCQNLISTTTDDSGRFTFKDVLPGRYDVSVQASRYIGPSAKRPYPEVVTQSIMVNPQQPRADLSFSLIKSGAIGGTVRDPSGKPVVSLTVQIWDKSSGTDLKAVTSTQTNDRGEYRLDGLPPGEFYVGTQVPRVVILRSPSNDQTALVPPGFRPPDVPQYAQTFYPGVPEVAGARLIALREGEEVLGIDVLLRPLPPVQRDSPFGR